MNKRVRSSLVTTQWFLVVVGFGVGIGASLQGCGSKQNPGEECDECDDQDLDTFSCHKANGNNVGHVCMLGNSAANDVVFECQLTYGGPFTTIDFANLVDCAGMADTAGGELSDEDGGGNGGGNGGDAEGADPTGEDDTCDTWNPGSHITLVSGIYHVDQAFVDDLVDHPYPMTECDTARFEKQTAGGYKLVLATSDTLFYKLGLRTNDVVLKINNRNLNTFDQVADAFGELYAVGNTLSYTVQYRRSGTLYNKYYVIDP